MYCNNIVNCCLLLIKNSKVCHFPSTKLKDSFNIKDPEVLIFLNLGSIFVRKQNKSPGRSCLISRVAKSILSHLSTIPSSLP